MILSHEGTWFMLLSHIQPIIEKHVVMLRYCCLCCFRTSSKISSNLKFFECFKKELYMNFESEGPWNVTIL